MRLQLLSDLHLETEALAVEPAPGAQLLVLAGDIDSSWAALAITFCGWSGTRLGAASSSRLAVSMVSTNSR